MCCPHLGEKQIVRLKCSSLNSCSDSAIKFVVLFDLSFVPFFEPPSFLSVFVLLTAQGRGNGRWVGGANQTASYGRLSSYVHRPGGGEVYSLGLAGWSSSGSARESLSQRASELAPVASLCFWRTMAAPPSNLPPPPPSPPTRLGDCEGSGGLISACRILTVWPCWGGRHHCPLNVAFLLKQIPRSKQQYERKADIVSVLFFIYLFFPLCYYDTAHPGGVVQGCVVCSREYLIFEREGEREMDAMARFLSQLQMF